MCYQCWLEQSSLIEFDVCLLPLIVKTSNNLDLAVAEVAYYVMEKKNSSANKTISSTECIPPHPE